MRGNEVDHHFSLLKIKESIHETKKMKEKKLRLDSDGMQFNEQLAHLAREWGTNVKVIHAIFFLCRYCYY